MTSTLLTNIWFLSFMNSNMIIQIFFLPKMYVINVINNKMKDDHMKGNAPTTHDTPNIGEKIYSCNTCSKNLIERKRLNMKTLM